MAHTRLCPLRSLRFSPRVQKNRETNLKCTEPFTKRLNAPRCCFICRFPFSSKIPPFSTLAPAPPCAPRTCDAPATCWPSAPARRPPKCGCAGQSVKLWDTYRSEHQAPRSYPRLIRSQNDLGMRNASSLATNIIDREGLLSSIRGHCGKN